MSPACLQHDLVALFHTRSFNTHDMTTQDLSSSEKIEHLKQLLYDYTFPEKIHSGMLAEIDRLLSWAIDQFISDGAPDKHIETYLGEPFIEISAVGGTSDWLYPCLPDEINPSDAPGDWYYDFHLRNHVLDYVTKKKWSFTK